MADEQRRILEQQLWNIANTLRGKMDADEFRDYILGFIFYKYLSEKMNAYADDILEADAITYRNIDESSDEGKQYLEAIREEAVESLGYFLKPSELFSSVAQRGNGNGKHGNPFILEDLQRILNNIEQSTMGTESEEDFDHLFEDLDLTSTKLGRTEAAKNELISKVLAHLDKIDFRIKDTEADVLGDAYEYLIAQFAAGAGKKAGEFYTPQEVSKVLAKLVTVGKERLKTVYDPTCGSGSLLLRVAREVKDVGKFYGQELNRTTYNLARMNMILHGVNYQKFNIKQEDSLEHPQHPDLRAEAIVANPPFSAKWSASSLHLGDERFSQYGRLAPSSKADWAFIQHMVHHLAENGTMAVVAPHGVLFRGGPERHIRRYLIEDRNYLDAVIGLPPNIFYGTDIETCILVFRKCRELDENILFINANAGYGKIGKQHFLRPEDIKQIVTTYVARCDLEKYSRSASIQEIAENGYFLNIARYVKNIKTEELIDITELSRRIHSRDSEIKEIDLSLRGLFEKFGLSRPIRQTNGRTGVKLSEVLVERSERNSKRTYSEVFSVAKEKGVVNQIEHLGRSYAAEDISNYKIVRPGDIVYTKSPTAGFPYGIIKQNKSGRTGVVSVLYAVYQPLDPELGLILDYYFSSEVNTFNYLNPLISKGAKNTINIGNDAFLNGSRIPLPIDPKERKEIAGMLRLLDEKLVMEAQKLEDLKRIKAGVLQQFFPQQR